MYKTLSVRASLSEVNISTPASTQALTTLLSTVNGESGVIVHMSTEVTTVNNGVSVVYTVVYKV